MTNWKPVLWIAMIFGIIASFIALDYLPQVSTLSMFSITLAMGFGAWVVWDMVLFGHVNTYEEIVVKRNVAYAVFQLTPALLVLAASLVK